MIDSVRSFIDSAAGRLNVPASVINDLITADKEHIFDVTLGSGKSYKAYRVQHNNKRGPYKGGIRFHEDVSLEEVQALAMLMSLKTAAIDLPMGGGKGGVSVNPRDLDEHELEEISRKYVNYLHPHIGPDKDVPAPDVNTDGKIIDWMVDEYQKITGSPGKATFTGKSIANGGSMGREAATGRGGVVALSELLRLTNKAGNSLTFAVQGFGNVGSHFATSAERLHPDWKLEAASDSESAVYNANGLKADELQLYKANRKRFNNYKQIGVDIISNDAMLGLDVDILVLAGFEDTVTAENMKNIKAKYIVELANGPIAGEAYDYLVSARKIILPDIIASSGGVIVSYLEWLQNKNGSSWTEEEVNNRMAKYIKHAVRDVYEYAAAHRLNLKEAAFDIAIGRLVLPQNSNK